MLRRTDAMSCGLFSSTCTLPNHAGRFRAATVRRTFCVPFGSSPSHCAYKTKVMPRTVLPSCAVRVLMRRYIVSGMSNVVLMLTDYSIFRNRQQYGFMDLWKPSEHAPELALDSAHAQGRVRKVDQKANPDNDADPCSFPCFKTTGNFPGTVFRSSRTHLGLLRYHRGVPLGWRLRLRRSLWMS